MSETSKYRPEMFGDMLYKGIGLLNHWLETDPERVVGTSKRDAEKLEIMEALRKMMDDLPETEVDDELMEKADETEYLATIQFWCSVTFTMAYRLQQTLVKELAAVPTAEGEKKIAEIRMTLVDFQKSFFDAPIFKAALARAALVGDAKFVTKIDFVNPKWDKIPDAADTEAEKK